MFRLFHGSIESNLRFLPCADKSEGTGVKFTDGMDLLKEIAALQKRLRKLRLDIDYHMHSDSGAEDQTHDANVATKLQSDRLETEATLDALQAQSPALMLQRKCDVFFPTLLQALDVGGCTGLFELQGLGYFPMDQHTFLECQTFVNDFHMELNRFNKEAEGRKVESSALFFRGNLLWNSIDTATMQLLYKFLRLREERGMTLIRDFKDEEFDEVRTDQMSTNRLNSNLWMTNAYENTFLPIWSSKLSYAECDAVSQTAEGRPHQRRAARSLHKQHPVSLATFLSEKQPSSASTILPTSSLTPHANINAEVIPLASVSESPASSTLNGGSWNNKTDYVTLKNAMKCRARSISYRNAGFLLNSGHFFKLLRLNEEMSQLQVLDETKAVWSPQIFPLGDASNPFVTTSTKQSVARHRVAVWHEADLTMIVLLSVNDVESSDGALEKSLAITLKRLNDYFEFQERFLNLAQFLFSRYNATFAPEKNMLNLSSLPPFLYINRVNLAFRMRNVPRLLKRKEDDLYPIPVKLLAHYFPASLLALLNELHAELHKSSSAGNCEICVRTRHAGWVLAKKSETSHRELYVFFDSKISSVHDLSDAFQMLLHDQFGNVLF